MYKDEYSISLEREVIWMPTAISIPLEVFGLGFVISMGIAFLIKLLLDAIKYFSKNPIENER